jgi:cold shock protein
VTKSGKVRWFNNEFGYGFIVADGDETGPQYFVHYSFIQTEGYKKLAKYQPVQFNIVRTRGGLQAHNVLPMELK